LPFNEPDQKGRWYCKLSPSLFIEFANDENDNVDKFIIHEMIMMTKKSSPEKFDEDVPENLKPYLGNYLFAAVNLEYRVYSKDGTIAIDDPIEKGTFKLQPPNEEGGWVDEYNKNVVYFEKDSEGKVINLKIDVANAFTKGELVSDSLEKLIRTEGIESAMQKYHLLRMESNPNLIFSERSINALGYRFLNEGKLNEAIEIFEMNVADYPESFNSYDSLGETYMKSGEKALAIENYQKSLSLNPQNENAKKRLEELKSK
jgi:tetratricopeptide (TPR) repeat protein